MRILGVGVKDGRGGKSVRIGSGKCVKENEGKIVMVKNGERRWTVTCMNVNNTVGKLIGCTSDSSVGREGD